MSLQRVWSFRSRRLFSRVLAAVVFVATVGATLALARFGLVAAAITFVLGSVVACLVGMQHRLRYSLGEARRGDDLLLWLEQHGGEYDFTERPVSESSFDIGRVLWRTGVDSDATVTDAICRVDGVFAFVAHHAAIEQFIVVPTPYLPTVRIDEARDAELTLSRVSGHSIQTDEVEFAHLFATGEALAHIEATGLGAVTLADGFLVARSPRFVNAATLDQRVSDLRHLLRALPKGAVRRFSREQELVTRLRTR